MHVAKMILMCSAPGAEEDKKHDDVTSNYPCLSEREHHTPFKFTEQKYNNIDDHPSVYTTLQQPSEVQ